jgi:sigma-B regulation protein RsbU (phosphoserine phosphatase)
MFAAAIFIISVGYMFSESREAVRNEAISHATEVLNSTALRVNNILENVEIATRNIDWLVGRHLDAPDSMFVYSRRILVNNPYLDGCSIAFEPYYFKEKGQYFSAFSLNENGTITTVQEGSNMYQYFYMDWYLLPRMMNKPVWTEPFNDYNPESIASSQTITSYTKPLTDKNGDIVGVISVDLALEWLSQTISSVKPYPNSYSIMLGRSGTFFVHPDSTMRSKQTIFTETMEKPNPKLTALGKAMLAGEEGMMELKMDGRDSYVFYKPLGNTGWSTAIVCPESDIFGGYNRLLNVVIILIIIGLLLMLLAFSRIFTHMLQPLSQLAKQAETIASGKFDENLPVTDRIDEIGKLSNSFRYMQTSLVNYIDELTRTTANKERIEGELRIAHDIQMGMIPRIFPAFPERDDIDIYASMTPAKEVGGDLYDFFIQNDKLYYCIGDVSGKGIPASLFMAVTRNLFRVVAQQELPPAEIARQINDTLSEDNDQGMFVTMFIGVINLKTGQMSYCNCGHNPPVIEGEFMQMEANVPMGLFTGFEFTDESIDNVENKMILLYTDGLNEAENEEHEQYGDDRLLAYMQQHANTAKTTINDLLESVAQHVAGAEPSDDLTMLCFKLHPIAN